MIRGKKIYLHCQDGQRSVMEQKSRKLGADLAGSIEQADIIYVVGQSAGKEDLESFHMLGKQVVFVNEDLIDQDLVDKLLSGKIRVKDAARGR